MTQLIRCMPWTTKLCPHPNIIKKMKTFLEVGNKMGPVIPAPVSQFRPPSQKQILTLEKVTPQKKEEGHTQEMLRPATPKATAIHLPLPQTCTKTY